MTLSRKQQIFLPSYPDSLSESQRKPSWYLVFCLLAAVFVVLASNSFGKDVAIKTMDAALVFVSGSLLVLAIMISSRFGIHGDHGKAYLMFVGFATSWFLAELGWAMSELSSDSVSFPAQLDLFYLGAYPFLLLFSVYYLRPLRGAITKKTLMYALFVTIAFLVPTLYAVHSQNPSADIAKILWADIYPAADAAVLFPAVLGVTLFFKGRVNLFWSLTSIAIILNVVADSGFFFLYIDKSYYTGHPLDVFYLWSYILFAFGINSHLRLYRTPKIPS